MPGDSVRRTSTSRQRCNLRELYRLVLKVLRTVAGRRSQWRRDSRTSKRSQGRMKHNLRQVGPNCETWPECKIVRQRTSTTRDTATFKHEAWVCFAFSGVRPSAASIVCVLCSTRRKGEQISLGPRIGPTHHKSRSRFGLPRCRGSKSRCRTADRPPSRQPLGCHQHWRQPCPQIAADTPPILPSHLLLTLQQQSLRTSCRDHWRERPATASGCWSQQR